MPITKNTLYSPATANTQYFASAATGASFTLAHNSIDGVLGYKIIFTNNGGTDLSGINVTLVGFDQDGALQTETFALPVGSGTATSTYYYSSLSSATPASTIGVSTVKIGYTDAASAPTFPLARRNGLPVLAAIVSGTLNGTIQYTLDKINQGATRPYSWISDTGAALTGFTATASDSYTAIPEAVRVIFNSYSAGASILFEVVQKWR